MSLAFRILYAVHGKGTHHKLALDALQEMTGPAADAWRRVFLVNAARYVEGAKAPDDSFKDFTNHVLHPRDGFWGGAPAAAVAWYGKLVAALSAKDWSEAAYTAGVLSHYLTDPLMPFHTAQSEAENNIHRAAEWSINRSYDTLRAAGLADQREPLPTLSDDPGWLQRLVREGAARSNRDYERLIAHYDIARGVVDPPAGLDPVGRQLVSVLLVKAAASVARVLDRAVAEARVEPPEESLLGPVLRATLQLPKAFILKRLADAADRRQVEAMYDELMATGRVEMTLPEDDRAVRERHAAEVSARPPSRRLERVPVPPVSAWITQPMKARIGPSATLAKPAMVAGTPARTADQAPPAPEPAPALDLVPAQVARAAPVVNAVSPVAAAAAAKVPPVATRPGARLELADDVERAPSIGRKTADRMLAVGVRTVAEFLAADPQSLAARLGHSGIDAPTLRLWQQQTRLVLEVPGINGTQARLLTGAGYLDARAVADADVGALCGAVLAFAASPAGQRVLRDQAVPEAARIAGWIDAAKAA
ncbi:MAG: DUF4332 domain-containing protein [Hyphomicrobiaceae bacterium]